MDKKQLKLNNFCKEYDVPRTTVLRWISSGLNFPAYNLCGHWYVDIEAYGDWKISCHQKSYKYAK